MDVDATGAPRPINHSGASCGVISSVVFGSGTSGVTCALAGLAIATERAGCRAGCSHLPAEEIEEVIVSGIRASMRDSLAVKRESMQVVDAISAGGRR